MRVHFILHLEMFCHFLFVSSKNSFLIGFLKARIWISFRFVIQINSNHNPVIGLSPVTFCTRKHIQNNISIHLLLRAARKISFVLIVFPSWNKVFIVIIIIIITIYVCTNIYNLTHNSKRPRGRAVSAPDFGSRGRGFESRWRRDSSRT